MTSPKTAGSSGGIFQTEIGNSFDNDDESSDDEIERQMLNISMQGKQQDPIKSKEKELVKSPEQAVKSPQQPLSS